MATEVAHEPENNRYVLVRDGEAIGLAEYHTQGGGLVFTHTEVDAEHRERGMAGQLVREALDDVRFRTDDRVVAQCPYVASWIDEHPDYQDLLTR